MFGSSSISEIGPDYLMQKDVVLVTFNFREGVFGKSLTSFPNRHFLSIDLSQDF